MKIVDSTYGRKSEWNYRKIIHSNIILIILITETLSSMFSTLDQWLIFRLYFFIRIVLQIFQNYFELGSITLVLTKWFYPVLLTKDSKNIKNEAKSILKPQENLSVSIRIKSQSLVDFLLGSPHYSQSCLIIQRQKEFLEIQN